MTDLLREIDLSVETVPVAEGIRANVGVVEPDGTTTKVNEQGPHLSPEEVAGLLAAVDRHADRRLTWLVGCGSLPPAWMATSTPTWSAAGTPPAPGSPSTPADRPWSRPSRPDPT